MYDSCLVIGLHTLGINPENKRHHMFSKSVLGAYQASEQIAGD